jgi:hypothetical protein
MRRSKLGLVAVGAMLLLPLVVHAKPRPSDGFGNGGFIYGAPPFVSVPIGDDDWRDATEVGMQWGFGGGYMFMPIPHFMLTVGGAFDHTWINFEHVDPDDFRGNIIAFLPEVRIGGGGRRIFGYGHLQTGLGILILDWDYGPFHGDETEAGFDLGLGGGIQGLVWRGLMIGAETAVDLGFYVDDDHDAIEDDTAQIHHLNFKFLIGWYF